MPDFVVTLTDEEAAAVALELVDDTEGRTPDAWLKDQTSWALGPAVTRYRIARANTVLTALADAPAGSSVADVQQTITDRVADIGAAPLKAAPVVA